jgi:cytochrome c553
MRWIALASGALALSCFSGSYSDVAPDSSGGATGSSGGKEAGSAGFFGATGASGSPGATGGTGGTGLFPSPGELTDPVITSSVTPPPISGGTLLVRGSGEDVIVSDPDHDQLLVVDADDVSIKATIALEAGDEPGRLAEDADGLVHVVLRGGGAVVTIDPDSGTLLERRAVCAYPRGIAYDPALDSLHVACADGHLVTLPAAGGDPLRVVELERDLRDVVVENGRVWVSLFRSATVLLLDEDGAVLERLQPGDSREPFRSETFSARVGWRLIAAPEYVRPGGGVLLVHQRAKNGEVPIASTGYSLGGCAGIVETAVTYFAPGEPPVSTLGVSAPLPVDIAVPPSGDAAVVPAAGVTQRAPLFSAAWSVMRLSLDSLSATPGDDDSCGFAAPALASTTGAGQAVAVAYAGDKLVVQTRDPWIISIGERGVVIPGESRIDTGHFLFHTATSSGLACASCHPEGREDGHTWKFSSLGPRRTQSIGGVLAGTEPFHWGGDEPDFAALVADVMTSRMSGPILSKAQVEALQNYIDAIPPWATPAPADADAVARGKAIFEREDVGCATCHSGPNFTNNKSYDVGTGAVLQVPSLLGLVFRAPLLHNGCAKTVGERFSECGGSEHGDVSALSRAELADLTTYLESL